MFHEMEFLRAYGAYDFHVWVRKSLRELCGYNVAKVTEEGRSIDRLVNLHLHRCTYRLRAAVAYVWADLGGDLGGSWHCMWNPGTAGSRLLPMRNQFQFRAGSPPAMLHRPVAKAARLALRLPGKTNKPRSATSYTCFSCAFIQSGQHIRARTTHG